MISMGEGDWVISMMDRVEVMNKMVVLVTMVMAVVVVVILEMLMTTATCGHLE